MLLLIVFYKSVACLFDNPDITILGHTVKIAVLFCRIPIVTSHPHAIYVFPVLLAAILAISG